jgi:uncharacterized repeat protein (TIGR04138 family)
MTEETLALATILRKDSRYSLDAYLFVREALSYASDHLELYCCGENLATIDQVEEQKPVERHISGQQLCDGIRQYALAQFGLMSKTVLNSWGIHSTGDFGDIVYNLIRVGIMKKSPHDCRSHFDNVYEFDSAFEREFEITGVMASRRP